MSQSELKVVVAGCGGVSAAWFTPAVADKRIKIVGLVDLKREAAQKRAAEFGLADAMIGTRLEEVLAATQPDVVFDCTLPEAHVDVTLTALKYGCHVLGEKPLADSMDNARRMVAAARDAGRVYAVMQNRRFDPNIRALRAFLDTGALGRITTVHCDFFIGAHFGGFRDRMRHVLLLDMAIHTFDAARFISGADPVSVLAHEWNPPGSWYDHDASAVAFFEMSKGIAYSYRGSWCAEGMSTTWEAAWRIIGEKGTVLWDGGTDFQAQAVEEGEGFTRTSRELTVPVPDGNGAPRGHAGLISDFVDCLAAGREPQTLCTDNIKSLAMVHGAIESAAASRRVDL